VQLALAIAPEDAQPDAFVVFRDRLDVTIPKVARMGYDGVELALGNADDVECSVVQRLLADHDLGIAAVSTGRVWAERHVWLTHPDAGVRAKAVEIIIGLADLAAELGARRVNIGRVRGEIPAGESRASAEGRFIEGIRAIADRAAELDVNLVIEPVNRYELNYINSVVPDGIGLIDRVGHSNVKLMPDTFHMNIEDVSIADSILTAGSMVGYCQLADSNRWAPGQGHTDFEPILAALRAIGYDDWVSLEILPYPSADLAAEQGLSFLRPLLTTTTA
jgi:sugar phosphate isomerase/epimerase